MSAVTEREDWTSLSHDAVLGGVNSAVTCLSVMGGMEPAALLGGSQQSSLLVQIEGVVR